MVLLAEKTADLTAIALPGDMRDEIPHSLRGKTLDEILAECGKPPRKPVMPEPEPVPEPIPAPDLERTPIVPVPVQSIIIRPQPAPIAPPPTVVPPIWIRI